MSLYTQEKKKKKEPPFGSLRLFLKAVLDYIICLYLILMLGMLPFYNEEGYAHIGTDKAVFFSRLSAGTGKLLALPVLLYLALSLAAYFRKEKRGSTLWEEVRSRITATDAFALIYTAALLLSYVCSRYRSSALWGARSWYMGLIPQLTLVLVYFLVSRLWTPRRWVLLLALPVSAAVFLLGSLNRFDVYPVEMEYASPSYISTIGNINWFCGYAVSVFFIGAALLWLNTAKKPWQQVLLMAYTALGFTTIVIQGSDSGLAALGAVLLLLFCLSVRDKNRMLVFWQELLLLSGGCLTIYGIRLLAPDRMNYTEGIGDKLTYGWLPIIMTIVSLFGLWLAWEYKREKLPGEKLFRFLAGAAVVTAAAGLLLALALAAVNTLHPGSLGALSEYGLFTLDEYWGSSRGATWRAGWSCFAEQDALHKLVGVGPDCMAEYIASGASEELQAAVKLRFGERRLTNAHNEWLTVLVNTGILGLAGFGGMMVCGMRELIKKGKENTVACACGICLLAYTVNNIFSFQQAVSTGTIFVIFGIGEAFLRREEGGR